MATKPATLPEWNSGGANRTTPSAPKLVLGYQFGEEPSSAFDNWWQNLVYTWIQYVDAPTGVTTTPAMKFVSGSGAGSHGIRVAAADSTNSVGIAVRAGTVTDGALDSLLAVVAGAGIAISSTNTYAIYATTTGARAIYGTAATFGVHGKGGTTGVETAGIYGEGNGSGSGSGTHGVLGDAGGASVGPNYGVLGRAGSAAGGAGVRGNSSFAGNHGVHADASGGGRSYALYVSPATSTPMKAAIHIDPVTPNFTGTAHVLGDYYVDAVGSIWGCVTAGTPGTFARIGPKGTATNDNAQAGCPGELVEATAAVGSITTWTTNVAKNITSISLTPGDWDVEGVVVFSGGAITGTAQSASFSTTTGTDGAGPAGRIDQPTVPTAASNAAMTITRQRFSLNATTTVFLIGRIVFTAGTPLGGGYISARRVR